MFDIFVFILLVGICSLVIGLLIQKYYYGDEHYAEAKVVGFQNLRDTNLAISVAMHLLEEGYPVVSITTDDGTEKRVRLNQQISKREFSRYPELDVGGTVDVLYFGKHPTQVYLVNHPLEQKVMRFSIFVLCGIAFIVLAIGLFVFYLFV